MLELNKFFTWYTTHQNECLWKAVYTSLIVTPNSVITRGQKLKTVLLVQKLNKHRKNNLKKNNCFVCNEKLWQFWEAPKCEQIIKCISWNFLWYLYNTSQVNTSIALITSLISIHQTFRVHVYRDVFTMEFPWTWSRHNTALLIFNTSSALIAS